MNHIVEALAVAIRTSMEEPGMGTGSISTEQAFDLGVGALAALVRAEYPEGLSLAEIGRTWGDGLSPDHLAALAWLDDRLATEPRLGRVEEATEIGEIEP